MSIGTQVMAVGLIIFNCGRRPESTTEGTIIFILGSMMKIADLFFYS